MLSCYWFHSILCVCMSAHAHRVAGVHRGNIRSSASFAQDCVSASSGRRTRGRQQTHSRPGSAWAGGRAERHDDSQTHVHQRQVSPAALLARSRVVVVLLSSCVQNVVLLHVISFKHFYSEFIWLALIFLICIRWSVNKDNRGIDKGRGDFRWLCAWPVG